MASTSNASQRFLRLLAASLFFAWMYTPSASATTTDDGSVKWTAIRPADKQSRDDRHKERKKMFEAFVAREAGLTREEAAVFFPLLHEYHTQQRDINRKIRRATRRVRQEKLSDRECSKLLDEIVRLKRSSVSLEEKYIHLWEQKISPAKVLKVIDAEHRFGRQMFRRFIKQKK